jgi:periplasmic divalent cation tolerance protein
VGLDFTSAVQQIGDSETGDRKNGGTLPLSFGCRLATKIMNFNHLVVFCTCPDDGTASGIAIELVGARLAACVNRMPSVRSTYVWNGKAVEDAEVMLVIKTTVERYPDLEVRLKSMHPYDEPEIIALPIVAGSASYLGWLEQEVAPLAATPTA